VIIRPAIIDDMPDAAMVQIIARRVNLPYLPQQHSRDEVMGFFLETVWPKSRVWVAQTEDGMITGFAAKTPGWLDHLYILPDYQGSGIGRDLLELAREGEAAMQLWTFQKNARARRFYENRGFRLLRETDGAGNMEKEPDALYGWTR
jgi:GNAT superfamily N-acetyltransferase